MKRTFALAAVAGLAALLSPPLLATPASAAVTVDTTVDEFAINGSCSLREAVLAVNANVDIDTCTVPADGIIALPAGHYDLLGPITVTSDITLVGADPDDHAATTIDCGAIAMDCFAHGGGSTFSLQALTVTGGNHTQIATSGGTGLDLADVTLQDGGHHAITTIDTPVHVERSIIAGADLDGINSDLAEVTITESLIEGSGDDGVESGHGDVTVLRSTLLGNGAFGIRTSDGDQVVQSSTIVDNQGDATMTVTGSVSYNSTTIVGNRRALNITGAGSLIVTNSIFADQTLQNCDNPVTSGGYNISDDETCALGEPTDRTGLDPELGDLGDNGGPTPTLLPLTDSPAIDTGGLCPAIDQRGLARPTDGSGDGVASCDVGAVEVAAAIPEQPTGDSEPVGGGDGTNQHGTGAAHPSDTPPADAPTVSGESASPARPVQAQPRFTG